MKLKIFVLIILSLELAVTKKFKICEFAKEIHEKHNVTRSDILKHICIASESAVFDTESDGDLVGIYRIGRKWWCGEKEASGGCETMCSKFLDDDIADDVACANKIFNQQGLKAWEKTEEDCISDHRFYVNECLEIIDAAQNNTITNETSTNNSIDET